MTATAPINLMLVEDERVVAFDLRTQLQAFGYRVGAVVASADQAVALAARVAPDLVVMDIHLEGERDGIDAATEIQAKQQIPVVFLTAYAEDETLRRALESRPFGYLVKPCDARELHATIQMALARRAVEVAVERSELRLKLALDAASLGVVEWDQPSRRMHGVGHLDALFGKRAIPIDESWEVFVGRVVPEDRDEVVAALTDALSSDQAVHVTFRTGGENGPHFLEAHAKAYAAAKSGNRTVSIVGILQDITRRHADEERLRQSSVVFHTTAEGIVITDAKRGIVAVNAAFTRITGFGSEEVLGLDPDILMRAQRDSDQFFPQLAAGSEGYWQGKVACHRKGGEPFPTWQSISVVRDAAGAATHFVTAFSDITSIHLAEHRLDYLAHHDPLTDLPNRLLFEDRCEHALDRARREQEHCLLLFIDLDGFKLVNDTLGHAVGDELLRVVGSRLKSVLRSDDTVARLGGDEFVVLADDGDRTDAANLAQKILDTLRAPIHLGGEEIAVSGSIGIAMFPEHGGDRNILMRAADIAMYTAKAEGRNRYRFYSPDLGEITNDRLRMEQGLRRAIESDALAVHYQPQIDLAGGRVVGIEALVRWPHPELGMILPERFIPIAEESDVIESLGRWVLRRACTDIVGLVDAAGRQLRLAVNVSGRQFLGHDFVAIVREVLAQTGFPADALELEITESTLQVIERSSGILNALKALGISVSIDDFGTGYSSLSVLRDLPIDRIKIDRSFIVDLPQRAGEKAIVEAVVALSRSLGMGITVEGIERAEQADILNRLGCGEGQGYYFSRPLAYPDLVRIIGDGLLHTADEAG